MVHPVESEFGNTQMQDKERYQTFLGLSTPWQVTDIELIECPECDCSLLCLDRWTGHTRILATIILKSLGLV